MLTIYFQIGSNFLINLIYKKTLAVHLQNYLKSNIVKIF